MARRVKFNNQGERMSDEEVSLEEVTQTLRLITSSYKQLDVMSSLRFDCTLTRLGISSGPRTRQAGTRTLRREKPCS